MKKIHLLLLFVLSSSSIFGQTFQATIKNGSTESSYKIFLKSNAAYSGIFTAITINLQIPSSIVPEPTISILSNPTDPAGVGSIKLFSTSSYDFSTKPGSQITIVTENGFHNYIITVPNGNSPSNNIIANTEFELFEVQFSAGVSNAKIAAPLATDVRLGFPFFGGSSAQQVFYLQNASSELQNSTKPFYGAGAINNVNADSYVSVLTTPLPLNLLSFVAEHSDGNAKLAWKTSDEVNVDHFQVSKSIDGQKFNPIGEVKATGRGDETNTYNFITEQKEELVYYRLKMVDIDGSFEYSKTLALKNKNEATISMSISPNPSFGDIVKVKYTSDQSTEADLILLSANGSVISKRQVSLTEGLNNMEIKGLSPLAQGLYVVRVQTDRGAITNMKLLK